MRRPAVAARRGLAGGRGFAVGAAAVLAVAVSASCATVPDSGPVVAGGEVRAPAPEAPRSIPQSPEAGDEPAQIINGFLRATDALDRFEVARQFLTDEAAQGWDPGTRIVHGPPTQQVVVAADGAVTITVEAEAEADITEDGRYTPRPATEESRVVEQTFVLERDGTGEWRIADLPNDILVSRTAAEFTLRPYPVYFAPSEPDGDRPVLLVPDLRWLPARSDSATQVVEVLLEGPSPSLYESVVRFGPGRRLTDRGVSVSDGIATVDFTNSYLEDGFAGSPAGRLFAAQVERSLQELPGVRDVRITVEDRPVDTSALPTVITEPVVNSRPYVLVTGTEFAADDAGEQAVPPEESPSDVTAAPPDESPDESPVESDESVLTAYSYVGRPGADGAVEEELGLRRLAERVQRGLAVSADETVFAGVAADGATLVRQDEDDAPQDVPTGGSDLTTPSFDPQGWLWTSSRTPPADLPAAPAEGATVLVVSPDGAVHPVAVQWSGEPPVRLLALRISRDGARALVVAERPGGRVSAEVRGVIRSPDGRPAALSTTGIPILPRLLSAVDATWITKDTVAVLGSTSDATTTAIHTSLVGGTSARIDAPPGARTLTAGRSEQSLAVGTEDAVFLRLGTTWDPMGPASSPAY